MDNVTIRLLWHPQAQFAGYLLAQHGGIAARYGLNLVTLSADFENGPLADPLRGGPAFAVASPGHVAECATPQALRIVLVVQQASALVYPARRDMGVGTVTDLRGKKAAVWPGGEDLELRWFLHRSGLSDGDVDRLPRGDTIGALLAGEVAVAQATTYNEIDTLTADGGPADRFVLLRAEDAGASLVKDALVCPATLTQQDPNLVQRVVACVLEGWTLAFQDPDAAVAACLAAKPDLDAEEQLRQLAAIAALTRAGATLTRGLGYPDPEHMARAVQAMTDLGERPPRIDAGAPLMDTRFWQAAPAQWRKIGPV